MDSLSYEQHAANVKAQTTDDDALLAVMRQRFQTAETQESESRNEELEDLRFSHGDQWPADVANRRRMDNRPCLTINQMAQFVRQVTNEQRQNRPMIRVLPVDDFADPATAKVFQGLIRHIEIDSDAEVAYDTAFEAAVRSGKGYFRIITEYEDEKSFDQVIKIVRIRNRFTVYMDPSAQCIDGSDADWCLIIERMSRDSFRELYPEADASPMQGWTSAGDGWVDTEEVRVAEYFFKRRVKRPICLLSDNAVYEKRFLPKDLGGRRVIAERDALFPEVHWVKSNGYRVLERSRFPGRFIPVIPVVGDEIDIEGQVTYSGIVRHAKDSQRMYNYWASAETETIALAPRTPWVGAEGQFEGHEQEWKAANTLNLAYLEYKPISHGGQPVPPPQRNVLEAPIQAVTNARLMSRDDLKATTGIYDASLGARGNETSGRAIIARQREGDVGNFHYPDNLARALKQAGRILISMIPQIYSTRRIVRILGEDNAPEKVTLNAPFQDAQGIERLYDMRVGRYDVTVDVGPSFATKRQETVATMIELTKIYPALFEVAGDLLIKNMDWPGAQEVAERLQLGPGGGNTDPKQQLAQLRAAIPELQKRLQAMHEYAKQCEEKAEELQQQNDELTTAAKSKAAELTVKAEENEAKMLAEQEKLALERRKVDLDEQRLALEVAKAQAELGDFQFAMPTPEPDTALIGAIEAIQGQLEAIASLANETQEALEAERAARQAPKTVQVSRRADGTLVGAVSSNGEGTRTIEIRPNGNGFQGRA